MVGATQRDGIFPPKNCVVAHARAAGHGGIQTTLEAIKKVFWCPKVEEELQAFVKTCLQCLCTRKGRIEPRPWGEQIYATKPKVELHLDFLYMGPSAGGSTYLLLLKDDGKNVLLVNCVRAGKSEAAIALLSRFALFGVVRMWVSRMS